MRKNIILYCPSCKLTELFYLFDIRNDLWRCKYCGFVVKRSGKGAKPKNKGE